MYMLNVQVIPAPELLPDGLGKITLLPAREGQGGEAQCNNCAGKGSLPLHDSTCLRCGGIGRARFVHALRIEVDPQSEWQRDTARSVLRGAPPGAHRQVLLRLEESGGGLTNTGHATIIAGMRGEPLRSVYGVPRCGAPHATFYVHCALVVQYSQARGVGEGTVTHIGVDRSAEHIVGVANRPLWRFRDGDEAVEVLDRATQLAFPKAAVDAARRKARCYHCRSAFYADGGAARGPSGALTGAGAACGGEPSPLKGPGKGY